MHLCVQLFAKLLSEVWKLMPNDADEVCHCMSVAMVADGRQWAKQCGAFLFLCCCYSLVFVL